MFHTFRFPQKRFAYWWNCQKHHLYCKGAISRSENSLKEEHRASKYDQRALHYLHKDEAQGGSQDNYQLVY